LSQAQQQVRQDLRRAVSTERRLHVGRAWFCRWCRRWAARSWRDAVGPRCSLRANDAGRGAQWQVSDGRVVEHGECLATAAESCARTRCAVGSCGQVPLPCVVGRIAKAQSPRCVAAWQWRRSHDVWVWSRGQSSWHEWPVFQSRRN